MTIAFTILAIVASVLSTGGIASQVIAWRRERAKDQAEYNKAQLAEAAKAKTAVAEIAARIEVVEVESKVEAAKVEVQAAKVIADDKKDEREQTGRFQQRLIDRVESLERRHDANVKRIETLETANTRCEQANEELLGKYALLDGAHRSLQLDHEHLKRDHRTLKEHVRKVEADNRALRARLGKIDGAGVPVEPKTIETGGHLARRAVSKQEEEP